MEAAHCLKSTNLTYFELVHPGEARIKGPQGPAIIVIYISYDLFLVPGLDNEGTNDRCLLLLASHQDVTRSILISKKGKDLHNIDDNADLK